MRHPVSLFCFVVVSSACVAGKIFKKSDLEAAAKHGTCSSCKADAPEGGFGVKQKRRGADGPMIPNAPTERIACARGADVLPADAGTETHARTHAPFVKYPRVSLGLQPR